MESRHQKDRCHPSKQLRISQPDIHRHRFGTCPLRANDTPSLSRFHPHLIGRISIQQEI